MWCKSFELYNFFIDKEVCSGAQIILLAFKSNFFVRFCAVRPFHTTQIVWARISDIFHTSPFFFSRCQNYNKIECKKLLFAPYRNGGVVFSNVVFPLRQEIRAGPSRFPCCVLLALLWNTTNEDPSTDKLSRAINYVQSESGACISSAQH